MYVITFKGRPATIRKLHEVEGKQPNFMHGGDELDVYISATSKARAKAVFIYWFGFTWKERAKGIDVLAVKVVL